MNVAYFDCSAGASGDMILGALMDAGADRERIVQALSSLDMPAFEFRFERVESGGVLVGRLHVEAAAESEPRGLAEIERLIAGGSFSPRVKDEATRVFRSLASAEAAVHGCELGEVHFHEVGAQDSIIDILGTVLSLELLGVGKVYYSTLSLGQGWVESRHGKIPVPAPATSHLLKGKMVTFTGVPMERTTPTAAALLVTLGEQRERPLTMAVSSVGAARGERSVEDYPNVLRVFLGRENKRVREGRVEVLECTIDDMSPEASAYLFERLYGEGALEVTLTPVVAKKSRPAVILKVLCDSARLDRLVEVVFRESTTLGLRIDSQNRCELRRESRTVETAYGPVRVKRAFYGDETVRVSPEFEDCRRIALEKGIPLIEVMESARRAASEQGDGA